MDDITLAPLLNAAIHANDGIQQIIASPLRAAATAAELPPAEGESSPKKRAIKKPQSKIGNFLKHPNSDSHKLETNQLLLETASRIHDAIIELEIYADILAADGSVLKHRKDNSRAAAANNIRNSIVPLLHVVANTLRDTSRCFAPYTGVERLHDRKDVERRRNLLNNRTDDADENNEDARENEYFDKSPSLLMIDDFVKRSDWTPPPAGEKYTAPSLRRKRKAKSTAPSVPSTISVTLLKPRNGTTYTKAEVVAIARQQKRGSRRQVYTAMVQQGYVPVTRRSLDRLMYKVERGEEVLETEWANGRPNLKEKPQPIDCNLTFDDLDTGDNRIVVEVVKYNRTKRQKEGEEEDEEGEMNDDNGEGSPVAEQPLKRPSPSKHVQKPLGLPKKKKKKEVSAKVAAFEVPPPRDGSKTYTKSEFVEVVKPYIAGHQHHLAIRAMMHRGYVGPVCKKTLLRLVEKDSNGEPIVDTAWTSISRGRPPKVTVEEIDEIVAKIKREDLRVYYAEDVKNLCLQAIMSRRVVDDSMLNLSERTVTDYFTMLKSKLNPVYWKRPEDN